MTSASEPPTREPAAGGPGTGERPRLRFRLVTGTAFSFVSLVVGQLFGLLTSILYARLLGPENLGVFAIYSQFIAVAGTVATLGLSTPITRFVAQLRVQNKDALGRFLGTVLLATIASTGVSTGTILLVSQDFGMGVYGSPELVRMLQIASGFLILDTLNIVGISILQGLQKIRLLSIAGIAVEAVTVPVMFVFLTKFGLVGAAAGGAAVTAIATFLLFGSALIHLRRIGVNLRLSFDRGAAKGLARYAGPLMASILVTKLALFFQTSFIVVTLGTSDAGLFRVASTISRIVDFVPAAMSVPLVPAIAELYASRRPETTRERINLLLRMTSYIGAPVTVGVALGAGFLIEILYGREYSGAATLAFVLVIAGFVNIIDNVATSSLLGEGRTGLLLIVDLVQAVAIVVATILFVGESALLGVGFASLTAALVYGVVILVFLNRSHRIDLRNVVGAFVPSITGFGLATIAVLLGGSSYNLWTLGPIAGFVGWMSWSLMSSREQALTRGALRDLFHSVRSD